MDVSPVEDALNATVGTILEVVPGADCVSVTLMSGEEIETKMCSDPSCLHADAAQYSAGIGPCIEAMRSGDVIHSTIADGDERWPEFAAAAAENGFTAVLALPLHLNGFAVGAVNIYSESVDGFSPEAQTHGKAFADQASRAIDYANLYAKANLTIEQLEEALKSRAVIDQAIGILMERESVDSSEALEMLKTASQHSNVRVREIARQLVEGKTTSI